MSTVDPDTPIPVPDIPGADVGARGLPDRSELTLSQRAIVDASAVADIGLRTAIASLVGAAMLPPVLTGLVRRSDLERERKNLAFYAELAAARDPTVSLPGAHRGAAGVVAAGQCRRQSHCPRQRRAHLVRQQLRTGQSGDAQAVAAPGPQ